MPTNDFIYLPYLLSTYELHARDVQNITTNTFQNNYSELKKQFRNFKK